MKRAEDSLRDLWDHIKCINIQIIGVPEEEEKKKGYEKFFEEIIVENFPNMEKEIANQVQEAQRVPYRINPRRNLPGHILIKLPEKEFRIMIVKMIKNLENKMEKMQESINKDLEELKNKHTETTQLLKLRIL